MKWKEAQKIMLNGGAIESQESFIRYEMLENGVVLAEGNAIDEKMYLTDKELNGEWKEAKFLYASTKKELMDIPDKDIQEELNKTYKRAMFNRKYR